MKLIKDNIDHPKDTHCKLVERERQVKVGKKIRIGKKERSLRLGPTMTNVVG